MERSQVTFLRVAGYAALKKMHGKIFVPFPFGIPQHRGFDGLDLDRIDRVNLVFALQFGALDGEDFGFDAAQEGAAAYGTSFHACLTS